MLDYVYGKNIHYSNSNMPSTYKQYDTKIVYAFDVAGMKIKCEEKFVNRTKEASLFFTGEGKILDDELKFYKKVPINTDIYEDYDWKVKNGVLYVTLFEKINEKPPIFRHIEQENE